MANLKRLAFRAYPDKATMIIETKEGADLVIDMPHKGLAVVLSAAAEGIYKSLELSGFDDSEGLAAAFSVKGSAVLKLVTGEPLLVLQFQNGARLPFVIEDEIADNVASALADIKALRKVH